jgi:hypothetical protein
MSGNVDEFFAEPLIAVRHKGCGNLVGVYRDPSGWQRVDRCRCSPAPALPDGADLTALIARAWATERVSAHRAHVKIYV